MQSTSGWFDTINGSGRAVVRMPGNRAVDFLAGVERSWSNLSGRALYPMGRRPRLLDGVAILALGIGLWIEVAGLCSRDCYTF
jgi:hypothetical protein